MRNPGLLTCIVCALIFLLLFQASCTRSRLVSVVPALQTEQALPAPQAESDMCGPMVAIADTLANAPDTVASMQAKEGVRDARSHVMSAVLRNPKTLLKKAIDLRSARATMDKPVRLPGQSKSRLGTNFALIGLGAIVLGLLFIVEVEALGVALFFFGLLSLFVGLLFLFAWLVTEWNSPLMPYNNAGKVGLLLFLLPLLIAFGIFFLSCLFYFGDIYAIAVVGIYALFIGALVSLLGLLVLLIGRALEDNGPVNHG